MAAKPRKNSPAKPGPRSEPRKDCPFSGNPLEYVPIRTLAAGHEVVKWQVRGAGWVSTQLFPDRECAEWFFAHENGIQPSFRNPYRRVELIGERKPPDPAEAAAKAELSDAARIGDDMAGIAREIMP